MKIRIFILSALTAVLLGGCAGYSNQCLYPSDIETIYVEMFDNTTFRRGQEYELTDAVAKRIELETPYKIVSDRSRADTVISGKIVSVSEPVLTGEKETGRPLEKQSEIKAEFSWKDLRTGELLIEQQSVSAAASFVEFQQQGFGYATMVAVNRLAERIVEKMAVQNR